MNLRSINRRRPLAVAMQASVPSIAARRLT